MIKIQNTKQIIWGFLLFAILFFFYSDKITDWIVGFHSPIVILLLATLLNPIYVFFIITLFQQYGIRGAFAGFLISISSDLISIPHIYNAKTGELSTVSYQLISDSTFKSLIPEAFNFKVFGINFESFLIYVVVACLLVIFALMITHKRKFKEIFLRSA